ncbi:MAG TPA: hypothetical protein VEC99_19300, partial [Clostridia bacterium]|nr:hypothetical protein [Clostridia bacterium]
MTPQPTTASPATLLEPTRLNLPPVVLGQHHQQMLKLVAKSFYNELINYGVNNTEVLRVAGHLLDNVMQTTDSQRQDLEYYNRLFTLKDVRDEWSATQRLTVHEVSLAPMHEGLIPRLAVWLRTPPVQESFCGAFPGSEGELREYFANPTREYFGILFRGTWVGLIGAEHIDEQSAKLEMRKLVGDPTMRGKGI